MPLSAASCTHCAERGKLVHQGTWCTFQLQHFYAAAAIPICSAQQGRQPLLLAVGGNAGQPPSHGGPRTRLCAVAVKLTLLCIRHGLLGGMMPLLLQQLAPPHASPGQKGAAHSKCPQPGCQARRRLLNRRCRGGYTCL